MRRILFILSIFLLSISHSTELCEIEGKATRSKVHSAQQCLKREIKKSIDIGQEYKKYNNDVKDALKTYYSELDICNTMYIQYIKSKSPIRHEQWNTCRETLSYSAKELRRLERQYNLLNDDYLTFQRSIDDLQQTLSLLKMKYKNLLGY